MSVNVYENGELKNIGGGGSAINYSTIEESTGGTWIDGKPIYRKVYNVDVDTYADQDSRRSFTYTLNDDIDKVVNTGGCWIVKTATSRPEIVGWTNTWGTSQMAINAGFEYSSATMSSALALRMLTSLWSGVEAVTFNVWVEYTKTTD